MGGNEKEMNGLGLLIFELAYSAAMYIFKTLV